MSDDCNPALRDTITRRIAASSQQRISFAEFMELALYHPHHGYYARRSHQIGQRGDFYTAPHLGPDFGELLAEQFVDMWHALGRPIPFWLVEMGPGAGILAADLLRYLQKVHPALFRIVRYVLVEISPALRRSQQQYLKDLSDRGTTIQWLSLQEIPGHSAIGCMFSNELVDAMPVHLVEVQQGRLREIYVAIQTNAGSVANFREVLGELSTARLAGYFELLEIDLAAGDYPEGYRSEVNLAACDWIQALTDRLQRGYLLTIDYGYRVDKYYCPGRSRGTLSCYYQHAVHDNPYLHLGCQDITTHVNFTALERWGDRFGLQRIGFTRQGPFLMALGLGDRLAALSARDERTAEQDMGEIMRRHRALHLLMHPHELGNWGVLVQGKGLTAAELAYPLRGFGFSA